MSDSAVAERVTLDSDLAIETCARMNAVGSLLNHLGGGALSDVADWLTDAADTLERTAFDQVDVLREDDDPVVVAIQARSFEVEADVMTIYDVTAREIVEQCRRNAEKIREKKTIALDFS